jgi:hypothetical protein
MPNINKNTAFRDEKPGPQAQVKDHRFCQKRLSEKGCVGFAGCPFVPVDLIVSVSPTFFSLQRAIWLLHQGCLFGFI